MRSMRSMRWDLFCVIGGRWEGLQAVPNVGNRNGLGLVPKLEHGDGTDSGKTVGCYPNAAAGAAIAIADPVTQFEIFDSLLQRKSGD
jgi:hypothetical protein